MITHTQFCLITPNHPDDVIKIHVNTLCDFGDSNFFESCARGYIRLELFIVQSNGIEKKNNCEVCTLLWWIIGLLYFLSFRFLPFISFTSFKRIAALYPIVFIGTVDRKRITYIIFANGYFHKYCYIYSISDVSSNEI